MKIYIILITLVTLLGCAITREDFVFDGSNEVSIKTDINHMLNKLPSKKKIEFVTALISIQFSDVQSAIDILGDPTMESMNYYILSKKMDGLTYVQVMELASKSPNEISVEY